MMIKICGLTDVREAEYLNRNQVDFAGFVLFYEKSRRNMTLEGARPIMERLSPKIKKVAVTVSPTLEQARRIEESGFDYIQIHGELSREVLSDGSIPILRAFNIHDMEQYEYYQSCPRIAGYVFDACEPGSGKAFDWTLLKGLARDDRLFLLAGGLNAENVQRAIQAVQPDGVDVSSGVEYEDGQGKDPERIDEFVRAVREGLCG
ncbi:MAG: phosphoribosylanthranilate isomerase [Butyrivibrio sp.]|nr:phosphoribosylanthranilate isomerase [Muribaculum sp.]MCM1552305.1 phosphoribosylanthranilate isomerase [Butyrivibrio sp.]